MRLFILSILTFSMLPVIGHAQGTDEQKQPPALKKMVEQGAQIFYLGEYENMKGWAIVRQGKPEIFYENAEGTALVMGLMFNKDGEMISMAQLSELRRRVGDDMYAATGGLVTRSESSEPTAQPQTAQQPTRLLTKSETMYTDLIGANWVTLNPTGKHDVFAFIDPDCPHCKEFIREVENHSGESGLRVRVLPVGTNSVSLKKAAILLASGDPEDRLSRYATGDTTALEAPDNINTDGAQNNLDLMIRYGFDATPLIVYKTGKGEVRMIRGRPSDYNTIITDITQN